MLGVSGRLGGYIREQQGKSALLLAAFFGALGAFSLPPYPFTPLFIIGLALTLLLVGWSPRGRWAFGLGFFFGLGHFGMSLYWVGESFLAQSETPHWLAPIAVILLVLYLSLFPGLAFLIARNYWGAHWGPRALIFAAIYTALEWLRGFGEIGFPWNTTASIWWPYEEMIQVTALVGSTGLGMLTIFSIGLFVALFDTTVSRRDRSGMALIGTILLGAIALLGWARLDANPVEYHEGVTVRLVQANIPQIEKWNMDLVPRNLARYLELSTAPAEGGRVPDYLVWPETAVPYDVGGDAGAREYLAAVLGNKVTLITGARRYASGEEDPVFNSVFALSRRGKILDYYDKVQLVPFGEYLPFRKQLEKIGLDTLVVERGDFARGEGLKTMTLPGLPPFSPLVCYEIIFPGQVVAPDRKAQWLLNLTNDAWFGITPGPYQHFEMARMRAVETGLPVVRVAGSGITGVIDPMGRVLSRLELGQSGVLDITLPRAVTQPTLYATYGNTILLILGLSLFGIGIIVKGGPKQD